MCSRIRAAAQVPVCILEPMSGHLVNPKSSKFLPQKILIPTSFRIEFYCLEKKFSMIFLITRIYTKYISIQYKNLFISVFQKVKNWSKLYFLDVFCDFVLWSVVIWQSIKHIYLHLIKWTQSIVNYRQNIGQKTLMVTKCKLSELPFHQHI